ncbi:MAG: NUDIX hydrolase [Flavobacteriales bacterium]
MYKVFISDRPLIFHDSAFNFSTCGFNELAMAWTSIEDIEDIYDMLCEGSNVLAIHLICENPNEAFEAFKNQHKLVEAAGGLVKSSNNRYLLIERLGYWDLPKGKVDEGETIAQAAIREVEEECGVNNLTIIDDLPTTYHTYEHKGKRVFKPTYWFSMSLASEPQLVAQSEEGITQAIWLNKTEANKLQSGMYASIWNLFDESINHPTP